MRHGPAGWRAILLEPQLLCGLRSRQGTAAWGRRNRTGYLTPPPKAAPGLRTVDAIQGQAERAFGDALLLPNGPARARVLIGALMLALKCLEVGSFEERISAVESRVSGGRL